MAKILGPLATAVILASGLTTTALADPRITSWYTDRSGTYARLYTSDAARNAGTAVTTWSQGAGVQSQPTYAGIHEISYSDNWVYIRTTGLGSHIMGPWYLNAARTTLFPNFPANTAVMYRIPRNPTVAATKTATGLGAVGYYVDGVAMFDMRDAFSYSNGSGADATPVNGLTGDGIWNRNAYVNEGVTFDAALAHQAGTLYHYHAQPVALRYLLGDHVTYNATSNRYTEAVGQAEHSPILAWASDGYPVYGPYAYSDATHAASAVTLMRSGYVLRNGTMGTTNLNATGRTSLPQWAADVQSRSTTLSSGQYGPTVSATYTLGHYIEDYAHLSHLGGTQGTDFDLDKHNGRFCVTPEFPEGTYAYFTTIQADGTPVFPYSVGRTFYGTPTGSAVTSKDGTITLAFEGGPETVEAITSTNVDMDNGDVTLVWTSIEGGSYRLEASDELMASNNFTAVGATVVANTTESTQTEAGASATNATRYYRVVRTALAAFDANGFDYSSGSAGGGPVVPASGLRSTTVNLTITLDAGSSPPLPPLQVPALQITVGGISAYNLVRTSVTTLTCRLDIPANAPLGSQDVVVAFDRPSYTLTDAFTFAD